MTEVLAVMFIIIQFILENTKYILQLFRFLDDSMGKYGKWFR